MLRETMKAVARTCLLLTVFFCGGRADGAESLASLLKHTPLITAQPDGVVYLNAQAAAIIRKDESGIKLTNYGYGKLGLVDKDGDRFYNWDEDRETPHWRIKLTEVRRYKVVVNRAQGPERFCTMKVLIGDHSVELYSPSTGDWGKVMPLELGMVTLPAGEHVVEFRPVSWNTKWVTKLQDVRLIPLQPEAGADDALSPILKKLNLDPNPKTDELKSQIQSLTEDLKRLQTQVKDSRFDQFTNYAQFVDYDRSTMASTEAKAALVQARKALSVEQDRGLLDQARIHRVLDEDEKETLARHRQALMLLEKQMAGDYPKQYFSMMRDGKRISGKNISWHRQILSEKLKRSTLVVPLPADAANRMRTFRERDNPENTEALCRQLHALLNPNVHGLERFFSAFSEGKYAEALIAYRSYFFAKMRNPEAYDASLDQLRFIWTIKNWVFFQPNQEVIDKIMDGVAQSVYFGRELIDCRIGEPGSVNWASPDLVLPAGCDHGRFAEPRNHPFWKTAEGTNAIRQICHFRALNRLPSKCSSLESVCPSWTALISSYMIDGNKAHLDRYLAYLDDMVLNSRSDIDRCPVNIRAAMDRDIESMARAFLTMLYYIAEDRPEFENDLPAGFLARFMIHTMKEYTPYLIVAKRTEIANWTIFGMGSAFQLAKYFHEFKVSDYYLRENWRLFNINSIQHRSLDGENLEAWDTGHNVVDAERINRSFIGIEQMHPAVQKRLGLEPMELKELWDHTRVNARNFVIHADSNGDYWPNRRVSVDYSRSTLVDKYLRKHPQEQQGMGRDRTLMDPVLHEPEVQARIAAILNGSPDPANPPSPFSEYLPYSGTHLLRESWTHGAEYLLMVNNRSRSQSQYERPDLFGASRTFYGLSKGGRRILASHSLAVDGRPDNRYVDVLKTGGKTQYLMSATRHVMLVRFHSSRRFDVAESIQDAPYAWHDEFSSRGNYGLYLYKEISSRPPERIPEAFRDNTPIRDVKAYRQIFSVRGEGVYIVNDRVESPGAHEYTTFFKLYPRIPESGFAARIQLLEKQKIELLEQNQDELVFRTHNLGFENVSVYLSSAHPLEFANAFGFKGEHVREPPPLEIAKRYLAKNGNEKTEAERFNRGQPVSAHWNGEGNEVLVSVLKTRGASDGTSADGEFTHFERSRGRGKVAGFHARTEQGSSIWYQAGPDRSNALVAGTVAANAECLLAVKRNNELSGVALSCRDFTIAGKRYGAAAGDFEFVLDERGKLTTTPIHIPIDSVRIYPDENVFVDTANVSFGIPTQKTDDLEFRYTLDGADPTLESTLFTKPFPINKTTMVKVKAFRKGLTKTPWTQVNTDCSRMATTIFKRTDYLAARPSRGAKPGLRYEYKEADWPSLLAYSVYDGVIPAKSEGVARGLLDAEELASVRQTDMAYALRYDGMVTVPADGIYAFYAPKHLYTVTMDAGFDLRVWVDGKEWFPAPRLHSENTWFVALEKGAHQIRVSYVDYRYKTFKNEWWLLWTKEQTWRGTPVLEISGPGVARQPIPQSWLSH